MKLELKVLVALVSTLCPPVAPNSELARIPSTVDLNSSDRSSFFLR